MAASCPSHPLVTALFFEPGRTYRHASQVQSVASASTATAAAAAAAATTTTTTTTTMAQQQLSPRAGRDDERPS